AGSSLIAGDRVSVKPAAPSSIPSPWPVTTTDWGMNQFSGVKVTWVAEREASVVSLTSKPKVTSAVGRALRESVIVSLRPSSDVVRAGPEVLTVTPAVVGVAVRVYCPTRPYWPV